MSAAGPGTLETTETESRHTDRHLALIQTCVCVLLSRCLVVCFFKAEISIYLSIYLASRRRPIYLCVGVPCRHPSPARYKGTNKSTIRRDPVFDMYRWVAVLWRCLHRGRRTRSKRRYPRFVSYCVPGVVQRSAVEVLTLDESLFLQHALRAGLIFFCHTINSH